MFKSSASRRAPAVEPAANHENPRQSTINPFDAATPPPSYTADPQGLESSFSVPEMIDSARSTQKDTLSTSERCLQRLEEIEGMARQQMIDVHEQGETIYKSDLKMSNALYNAKASEHKATELSRLQRFFFLPVKSAKEKLSKLERKKIKNDRQYEAYIAERDARREIEEKEQRQKEAYRSKAGLEKLQRNVDKEREPVFPYHSTSNSLSMASSSATLHDNETPTSAQDILDTGTEKQITQNLNMMAKSLTRLKLMSENMGEELERQNKGLDSLATKTDETHVRIRVADRTVKNILHR